MHRYLSEKSGTSPLVWDHRIKPKEQAGSPIAEMKVKVVALQAGSRHHPPLMNHMSKTAKRTPSSGVIIAVGGIMGMKLTSCLNIFWVSVRDKLRIHPHPPIMPSNLHPSIMQYS